MLRARAADPRAKPPASSMSRPGMLSQVIENLLLNSLAHGFNQSVSSRAQVEVSVNLYGSEKLQLVCIRTSYELLVKTGLKISL